MLQLLSHISSLKRTRENLQQGRQGYHLIQLLQMFRGLKASDHKDQLFAFWGLACDQLPPPDYGCSTEAVFIKIARWLLEDAKNLSLLAVGLRSDQSDLRLPSWVPNWASGCPFEDCRAYTSVIYEHPSKAIMVPTASIMCAGKTGIKKVEK